MIRYKYWKQYCKTFIVAAVCFFLQVNSCLLAQEAMRLPRSTPASQGVSAAGIGRFLDAAKASGIIMLSGQMAPLVSSL
jgi:hypothetical protein